MVDADQRCEQCGALLTPSEQRVVLEDGGPALCSVHAADVVPLDDDQTA